MINNIYNEDCLVGMKRIPDNSIDLVVTSPPYNIGKEYEGKQVELEIYKEWLIKVFIEIKRVLKHGGTFILNVGTFVDKKTRDATPLSFLLFPDLIEMGFKLRQNIVWKFKGGMQAKLKLTGQYEDIMVLYKAGGELTFNIDDIRVKEWETYDKRNNPNGKNPTNVWEFNRVASGSKEKWGHPCQYPIAMIDRVVKGYSNSGNVILDPFMGSGTTAIACLNTNRNYIGFELDKEYYDLSLERIEKHKNEKIERLF